MTSEQYRRALARLGLTQNGAARLFGIDDRTSRRYVSGDSAVPTAIVILLRLLLAGKLSTDDVARVNS